MPNGSDRQWMPEDDGGDDDDDAGWLPVCPANGRSAPNNCTRPTDPVAKSTFRLPVPFFFHPNSRSGSSFCCDEPVDKCNAKKQTNASVRRASWSVCKNSLDLDPSKSEKTKVKDNGAIETSDRPRRVSNGLWQKKVRLNSADIETKGNEKWKSQLMWESKSTKTDKSLAKSEKHCIEKRLVRQQQSTDSEPSFSFGYRVDWHRSNWYREIKTTNIKIRFRFRFW